MIKNKLMLISMLILVLVFNACAPDIVCMDGTVVKDAKDCPTIPNEVVDQLNDALEDYENEQLEKSYPSLEESEIITKFLPSNFRYVEGPNQDSLVKREDIKLYDGYVKVDYKFSDSSLLKKKTVYLKILNPQMDSSLSDIVYDNKLESGTHTLDLNIILPYIGETPKLSYCFGTNPNFDPNSADAICIKKGYDKTSVDVELLLGNMRFDFDTRETGDVLTKERVNKIKNSGNTYATFYIYVESYPGAEVETSFDKIFLKPGEETSLTVTTKIVDDGTLEDGESKMYIYAIPDNCEGTLTCAKEASFKKEVTLEFRD